MCFRNLSKYNNLVGYNFLTAHFLFSNQLLKVKSHPIIYQWWSWFSSVYVTLSLQACLTLTLTCLCGSTDLSVYVPVGHVEWRNTHESRHACTHTHVLGFSESSLSSEKQKWVLWNEEKRGNWHSVDSAELKVKVEEAFVYVWRLSCTSYRLPTHEVLFDCVKICMHVFIFYSNCG